MAFHDHHIRIIIFKNNTGKFPVGGILEHPLAGKTKPCIIPEYIENINAAITAYRHLVRLSKAVLLVISPRDPCRDASFP